MSVWTHASRDNPCPICTKTDWCRFGDRAMLCMRVESSNAWSSGGWLHFYDKPNPEYIPRQKSSPPPRMLDARRMLSEFGELRDAEHDVLGVSYGSLQTLDAKWSHFHKAIAFPMFDGAGTPIGIRLRNSDGFKWAVPGSRNGIFLPNFWEEDVSTVFLPEGPTDTAALLTLGLFSIGRPNVLLGAEHINAAIARLGVRRAVVVADNDDMKKIGTHEGRPGIEGAERLKKMLCVKSTIYIPPSPLKDVREFVRMGGTRSMIEADLKNKVWTR